MKDFENIEDWYRQEANNLKADPPKTGWEELAVDLEIEDVWARLEGSLDKKDRKIALWYWPGRIAAILIPIIAVSLALIFLSSNPGSKKSGMLAWQKINPSLRLNLKTFSESNSTKDLDIQLQKSAIRSHNFSQEKKNELVANSEFGENSNPQPDSSTHFYQGKNLEWSRIIPKGIPSFQSSIGNLRVLEVNLKTLASDFPALDPFAKLENEDQPEKNPVAFYVGGITGVNNQWLLSHDTYNSFKKAEPMQTEMGFHQSFGLSAGIGLSPNLGIHSDFMFISKGGQKYIEYRNGHNQEKVVNFDYIKLIILTRLNRKRAYKSKRKFNLNFLAGMYGGYLVSGEQILDGQEVYDISSEYKKSDLGIVGGMEMTYLLGSNFSISPGFRIQQGMLNIFNGTNRIPSDFNRTYNSTFEVNLGFRYFLQK